MLPEVVRVRLKSDFHQSGRGSPEVAIFQQVAVATCLLTFLEGTESDAIPNQMLTFSSSFVLLLSLELSDTTSYSLTYEPSEETLHKSAEQLFLDEELYRMLLWRDAS